MANFFLVLCANGQLAFRRQLNRTHGMSGDHMLGMMAACLVVGLFAALIIVPLIAVGGGLAIGLLLLEP